MTAPLVSVLIATWNGADFVGEALESVLGQTYRPLEAIVVDDGSTDVTPDLVRGYAARFPDLVRLDARSDRAGPCRRRNDALAQARGPVLAWLDQDDVWAPDKLERQLAVLAERPEVGLVYTDYEEFDAKTGRTLPAAWPHPGPRGDILAPLFVEGCFVFGSTAVWRREAMATPTLRASEFSFGDDYALFLGIALRWQTERFDDVLVRLRRHDRNESRSLPDENFHLRRIQVLAEFLAEFAEAEARLGRARRTGFARHHVRAARFEAARGRPGRAAASALRAGRWHPGVVVERIAGELRPEPRRRG
jgi:glycosyltransferase involved in cell wall biosynthesis